MTESEIEKALLSQQGSRIPFNASSGTGAGGEIYNRSHHQALDFVGEEEEIDENEGNFCDTPDSLFRLSHAGRYSRLRGDESCGAIGQEFEFSHQMSMCRLVYDNSTRHVQISIQRTLLHFISFLITYGNTSLFTYLIIYLIPCAIVYSLNSFFTFSANSQDSVLSAIGFSDPVLEPGDIVVEKMHIHYGMKDKNPLNRMRFFAKVRGPLLFSLPQAFYSSVSTPYFIISMIVSSSKVHLHICTTLLTGRSQLWQINWRESVCGLHAKKFWRNECQSVLQRSCKSKSIRYTR